MLFPVMLFVCIFCFLRVLSFVKNNINWQLTCKFPILCSFDRSSFLNGSRDPDPAPLGANLSSAASSFHVAVISSKVGLATLTTLNGLLTLATLQRATIIKSVYIRRGL